MKVHGTTGERPLEQLRSESLKPLPPTSVCRPYQWETRKVARDCFVSFNGARYGVKWRYCGQTVRVRQQGNLLTIAAEDGEILQIYPVCHQARKHIWAKDQYAGLVEQEGKPYAAPYGFQIPLDEVEVRPLTVYESLSEAM
jgi:hypothetical protein